MRVLFISTGLGVGGAEVMLVELCREMLLRGNQVGVIGLKSPDGVSARLTAAGIVVWAWDMAAPVDAVTLPMRLISTVRDFRPDLIQGWMYQGCLAATYAGWCLGIPVSWSLHHSNFDRRYNRLGTLASIRVSAWVSHLLPPEAILYCGPNSRDAHHRHGFGGACAGILPNGVDFDRFRPDGKLREAGRRRLGLDSATTVIGIFANRVPIKDHATFLAAAAELNRRNPEVRFVCCGTGMVHTCGELQQRIDTLGLTSVVHLCGRCDDVAAMMNACDLIVLTSRGESFPVSLTEAVACGVPVVATRVGDCAWVVGDDTRMVEPGDAAGLARIWRRLLAAGAPAMQALGLAGRTRAQSLFTMRAVTDLYERHLTNVCPTRI